MPSKGTKYTTKIQRLRDKGLSDGQIAERLSIGRSIVTRNLYDYRSKQRLAKLMTQAGLYGLKQVLVSAEVGWRWIEAERLELLEGEKQPDSRKYRDVDAVSGKGARHGEGVSWENDFP